MEETTERCTHVVTTLAGRRWRCTKATHDDDRHYMVRADA